MADKKIDAQEVLKKDKNEMSEMEKMMASIIEKNNTDSESNVDNNTEAPALEQSKKRILHEIPQKPDLPEEFYESRETNLAREKSITKATRKRNKKMPVIGILTAFFVGAFVLFGAMVKNINDSELDNDMAGSGKASGTNITVSTPEPQEILDDIEQNGTIVIMSGTNKDESDGEIYKVFISDLSWTEAKKKCESMKGHLVTIASEDELKEVIAIAEDAEIDRLWVGCHRDENGQFIWENGEKFDIPTSWWGKNEPSKIDLGDNVPEDYLLLWYNNGKWSLNDSRNDPCADYPEMYRGYLAYVCEFEKNRDTAEFVINE